MSKKSHQELYGGFDKNGNLIILHRKVNRYNLRGAMVFDEKLDTIKDNLGDSSELVNWKRIKITIL